MLNSSAVAAAFARAHTSVSSQEELLGVALEAALEDGDEPAMKQLMLSAMRDDKASLLAICSELIFACCEKGFAQVVSLMLANGVDTMLSLPSSQQTPLHVACEHGRTRIVQVLLTGRAQVSARDRHGLSPLGIAAAHGELEIARLLLAMGAAVNSASDDGTTPLHASCARGHLPLVRLLLSRAADVTALLGSGETPLSAAARRGHAGCLAVLLGAGARDHEPWRSHVSALEAALVAFESTGSAQHAVCVEMLRRGREGAVVGTWPLVSREGARLADAADASQQRTSGKCPPRRLSQLARSGAMPSSLAPPMVPSTTPRTTPEGQADAADASNASLRQTEALLKRELARAALVAERRLQAAPTVLSSAVAGTTSLSEREAILMRELGRARAAHVAQAARAASAHAARAAHAAQLEAEIAAEISADRLLAEEEIAKGVEASSRARAAGKAKERRRARKARARRPGAAGSHSHLGTAGSHSHLGAARLSEVEAEDRHASLAGADDVVVVVGGGGGDDVGSGGGGGGDGGGGGGGTHGGGAPSGGLDANNLTVLTNLTNTGLDANHLPGAFLCPITQEPMVDPVVTADGQTYEREAIQRWIEQQRNRQLPCTSPLTGEPLEHCKLVPNVALRGLIRELLEISP